MNRGPDAASATVVLLRYAAAIDGREWEALRDCLTADCRAEYDDRVVCGVEELVRLMAAAHRRIDATVHLVTNVQCDPSSPAVTTAEVDATLIRRDSGSDVVTRISGVYRDSWMSTDAGWRIARRQYGTTRRSITRVPARRSG